MHVLQAFSLYGNPSEVWNRRLLNGLHGLGVRQTVLSALAWPGYQSADPWPVLARTQFGNKLSDRIRHQLAYARLDSWLKHQNLDVNPAVLHAHFGPTAWRFLPFVKKHNIPLLVSFYGTDYEALPARNPLWRKRYSMVFHQAAHVLAEGPFGASVLEKMGCDKTKIRVLPLGIEAKPDRLFLKEKETGSLKLVQVASFVEKKGQEYSLRAFAQAVQLSPNIQLTLAGDGTHRRVELQKLAHELGVASKVYFQDFVPYDTLDAFLSDFDVFIHPSVYARDRDCEGGAPTIIQHALALGIPVLATRHCDIPFVVSNQKNGLLVPERDVLALAQGIQEFYHMPHAVYKTFSKAAQLEMRTRFTTRQSAELLLGLYQELL
ncbi:MAG: glycosyltransferase family 4 protein [Saprospiraceae bacterium]